MIAVGHKYGLLALGADAQLDGHLLEIGKGLVATHELPVEIPDHWTQWLGSLEVRRIKECKLFVLTSVASETPEVLDDESIWLEHRLELLLRAAALTSIGFRIRHGHLLLGARTAERVSVRHVRRVDPVVQSPGMPRQFVLTRRQMVQAERLVPILWELGLGGTHGRLWRALRAFDAALHTVDLAMRLHQLVRAIEGIMPIPASSKSRGGRSQRDWFADKASLLWAGTPARDRLLAMYDARGATEHLALPVRDLQRLDASLTAADAEIPFAGLVFLAEGLARHALVRVLEAHSLRDQFDDEESMLRFWAQSDADIGQQWGDAFPAEQFENRFDAARAGEEMERYRGDKHHRRVMLGRAPASYRGSE